MEKDNEEKKDKSKKNIFSKIFKKKKKDEGSEEKKENTKTVNSKIRTKYYAALTGMPGSSFKYFCEQFYMGLHDVMYRDQFSQEVYDRIVALSDDTKQPSKIEVIGRGVNFTEILPVEISLKIFSVLEPQDLIHLNLVNKKSHEVLSSPNNWQTLSKRADLASFGSLVECSQHYARPLSFELVHENIERSVRYDIRPDLSYWKDRPDDIDYSFFIVTVNFGKFDEQEGEDKSTNYLRRTADFLAEIARVPPGQSASGLEREMIIVCMGGGDLRTKIDKQNISFQKYFPEATRVIQGSVMDIMDHMEDMYKAKLSNEALYGTIHLHVMEKESLNEYRAQHKVANKIRDIMKHYILKEKHRHQDN